MAKKNQVQAGATKTSPYRDRWKQLKDQTSSEGWLNHWRELAEYFLPRRGKYLSQDTNDDTKKGGKKHQKVINGEAADSVRTLAAGMQGGLTSPSRPWFQLALADNELMEYAPVKEWLEVVRNGMLNVFARSNFYVSTHGVYRELGVFGTNSMLMDEDVKTVIRCRPFTIGEFRLTLDDTYRPNALYRQFAMTATQMAMRFGMDKLLPETANMAKTPSRQDKAREVLHVIEPLERPDRRGMRFRSVYFELSGDQDHILHEGGYRTIPFIAPRWDVSGINTYGDSPGMDALGDNRMLQKMEEKGLKAIDKMVDPPMNAPTALKGKAPTIIPGGVNYYDATAGTNGFTAAHEVKLNIQHLEAKIEKVEGRIKRAFFNDLFLAILGTDKNMTATEVVERHEEKMLMLGPVIERLESEMLDVIIERTYNIMESFGMLPPAPPEMQGQEIKIQYISLLAQAQRLVSTTAIERVSNFVGAMAQIAPEVIDKLDADEVVDQYAESIGVSPELIRSDDAVAEIREQRAQQEAAQAAAAMAAQAAESGKTLSETELDKGSALDSVIEQSQAVTT